MVDCCLRSDKTLTFLVFIYFFITYLLKGAIKKNHKLVFLFQKKKNTYSHKRQTKGKILETNLLLLESNVIVYTLLSCFNLSFFINLSRL